MHDEQSRDGPGGKPRKGLLARSGRADDHAQVVVELGACVPEGRRRRAHFILSLLPLLGLGLHVANDNPSGLRLLFSRVSLLSTPTNDETDDVQQLLP